MHTYTPHNKKGFTLVETLVAIGLLLLVIIGPMASAQKGIQNAYYAKEQVTAVYLAQEAIEAVRALRDDEALSVYENNSSNPDTSDWTLNGCGSGCTNIAFDAVAGNFNTCTNYNNCVLKLNAAGKYVHSGSGTNSAFTRIITFGAPVNGGVLVTVDVSWNAKIFGSTKTVKLQTWIYDHYQRYQ